MGTNNAACLFVPFFNYPSALPSPTVPVVTQRGIWLVIGRNRTGPLLGTLAPLNTASPVRRMPATGRLFVCLIPVVSSRDPNAPWHVPYLDRCWRYLLFESRVYGAINWIDHMIVRPFGNCYGDFKDGQSPDYTGT